MGLFDKVKEMARAVSGGGAKVTVEVEPASVRSSLVVNIKATVGEANLSINGVYLLLRAEEELQLDAKWLESMVRTKLPGTATEGRFAGVSKKDTVCELKAPIAGPQQLEARKEYVWKGEVALPAGARPTFTGKSYQYRWQVQAGLDAAGNDPDSGWITITIS